MVQLEFDAEKRILFISGGEKQLTKKESGLLNLLLQNKNSIVDRNTTLNTLWGTNDYYSSRSLDVFITKLRYLLKPFANVKIECVHGKGHILKIDESEKEENL